MYNALDLLECTLYLWYICLHLIKQPGICLSLSYPENRKQKHLCKLFNQNKRNTHIGSKEKNLPHALFISSILIGRLKDLHLLVLQASVKHVFDINSQYCTQWSPLTCRLLLYCKGSNFYSYFKREVTLHGIWQTVFASNPHYYNSYRLNKAISRAIVF